MRNILYIGNQLSQNGKTLTTIDSLSQLLRQEGFQVFTASKKKNKFLRLFNMLFHVINYRKQADYVLIDTYSTFNFYFAYFVSQLCRLLKLKYIPILHGGDLPNRLKQSPKLTRAIFKNAFVNVAPSQYTQASFEKFGFSNITCIPNSIELKKYPFKKRTFDTIRLLWVRSFSKIYNPSLAIDVLNALKNENRDAELCMIGPDNDGSLLEAKKYADQLGLEVTFTGKLSKQKWIRLSEDYNIFINTTNIDNMPVSVIEAMALGLPLVSTNVGGLPFLIEHDKTGFLVEPNSVVSFVESIEGIIDSPNKTHRIMAEARDYAEKLDWENVKKQWINVLK